MPPRNWAKKKTKPKNIKSSRVHILILSFSLFVSFQFSFFLLFNFSSAICVSPSISVGQFFICLPALVSSDILAYYFDWHAGAGGGGRRFFLDVSMCLQSANKLFNDRPICRESFIETIHFVRRVIA
jgi:hypothetical protein